jgi:tRNA G18 (ribose-2'-O)-methylase SpoU
VALVPPLDAPADAVRAALAPLRNDLSIALHSVGNAFSVGAIIRVAHSFLVREVVVIGEEPYYAKASMGMEKYETIVRVPDDDAFFAHVRDRPVWGIEKDHARRSLYDVGSFPRDVVLVVGGKHEGLSDAFARRCDDVIGIPIYGVNHSLPVVVAAGIVMNEWARRRYAGGAVVAG